MIAFNFVSLLQIVPDSHVAASIHAYLRPFAETGNFSGAVLVARKGQVLLRESYGMASYDLQVANAVETRFHIASVSEAFTAAAILQLEEQGRVNVTDLVSQFVPDFPDGDRITVNELLTQRSGISDVVDLADYDSFARSPHTLAELVAKIAGLSPAFQPGSAYRYSSSNYELLAFIVEKVSGDNYGAYLRNHIFRPADMPNSGDDGGGSQLVPFAASGYRPAGIAGYEKMPYLDWSNRAGDGSLYSTVDDLYRFDRALYTNVVLTAPERQKYFAECPGSCYGWHIGTRLGHRVMSAQGRSPGFTAELDRFVDDDVTVIVLSNSSSTVSQSPIAEGLAAIVFGQQPPPVAAGR